MSVKALPAMIFLVLTVASLQLVASLNLNLNINNAGLNITFSEAISDVKQIATILIEILPDVAKSIKIAEDDIENALQNVSYDSDPAVTEVLEELLEENQGLIRVGKMFLWKCLQMSMYATSNFDGIKKELELKILVELKLFIHSN